MLIQFGCWVVKPKHFAEDPKNGATWFDLQPLTKTHPESESFKILPC